MTVKPPAIATPPGVPPPDLHAQRIVWEMLQYLHAGQETRWAKAKGAINSTQMGSPKGQQRAVERFAKLIGDLALRIELAPAKRGKFRLRVIGWMPFNPVANDVVMPGERLPPTAQLAVITSYATGKNYNPQWDTGVALLISRHAMIRLATRGNVRTIKDLLVAVRECWDAAEGVLLKMVRNGLDEARRHDPHAQHDETIKASADAWFAAIPAAGVRAALPDGGAAVIAHASTLDKRLLIVKTILSADMLDANPAGNDDAFLRP